MSRNVIDGVANTVLMVRPKNFHFNFSTARDNFFQHQLSLCEDAEELNAREEFDNLVRTLRTNRIGVLVFEDLDKTINPDSIFPNNWFSTHSNGYMFLYPMHNRTRRRERRKDIIEFLKNNYDVTKFIDYTEHEKNAVYLESTGSVVFDHHNKIAYAALSERTSDKLLHTLCKELGYKECTFNTVGLQDSPVYHTNVMMSMGVHYVICCIDVIDTEEAKNRVKNLFKETGKELVNISVDQMNNFAGNVLQLRNFKDELMTVMSERAFNAFDDDQKRIISKHSNILAAPIKLIEEVGGGGVRCMMAEIFLKNSSFVNYETESDACHNII